MRLKEAFNKKKPFIGYLTAGDGGFEHSVQSFLDLIEGGVDLLEVGIPFSDPVVDGPVIQRAMQRSLDEKTTPDKVLDIVEKIREKSDVPIVLFSYYNPILQAKKGFFQRAKQKGVDAFLIIDLPPEEAEPLKKELKQHDLDLIFVISPVMDEKRIRFIDEVASGFLYYVSQMGTTGARSSLPKDFHENLQKIQSITSIPVVAGFGISSQQMASEFLKSADGFVIGSKFVEFIEKKPSSEEVQKFVQSLDPRSL